MNKDEFLAFEKASRDTIDVKRVYIDMAGDLAAGVLLSQIVYWHLPDESGKPKLRVFNEEHLWLAKRREDWWDECRLTPRQFDTAIARLADMGIVETKVLRFNGSPTKHVRIEWDKFLQLLAMMLGVKSISRKCDIEVTENAKSITENTNIDYNTSPTGAAPIPKPPDPPPEDCEILGKPGAHHPSSRGDHMRLLRRVQDVCGVSEASTSNAMARLHQATKYLTRALATPELMDEFGAWWWGCRLGHRANAPPSLSDLRNEWGKFMIWRDKRDEDVNWLD